MTDRDADLVALEARAIDAETRVAAAIEILAPSIDEAFPNPVLLQDVLTRALDALGGLK